MDSKRANYKAFKHLSDSKFYQLDIILEEVGIFCISLHLCRATHYTSGAGLLHSQSYRSEYMARSSVP